MLESLSIKKVFKIGIDQERLSELVLVSIENDLLTKLEYEGFILNRHFKTGARRKSDQRTEQRGDDCFQNLI